MRCKGLVFAVMCLAPGLALGQERQDEPPVAQVKCNDGTISPVGRDACSDHGGVAWNTAPPTKRTPVTVQEERVGPQTPAVATPAMVRCRDGSLVDAGVGACSRQGGIDKATSYAPLPAPGTRATRAATEGEEDRTIDPKGELANPPR